MKTPFRAAALAGLASLTIFATACGTTSARLRPADSGGSWSPGLGSSS